MCLELQTRVLVMYTLSLHSSYITVHCVYQISVLAKSLILIFISTNLLDLGGDIKGCLGLLHVVHELPKQMFPYICDPMLSVYTLQSSTVGVHP